MKTVLAVAVTLATSFSGMADARELEPAFDAARADAARARAVLEVSRAGAESAKNFVPARCSVESWCLVRATDCFLGVMHRPGGLWRQEAQYSVVRRAVALCPNNGRWERRAFLGPVEPQVFRSVDEAAEQDAVDAARRLCEIYRKDWVSAAPACT